MERKKQATRRDLHCDVITDVKCVIYHADDVKQEKRKS